MSISILLLIEAIFIVFGITLHNKDQFAHGVQKLFLLNKDDQEKIIALGLDNFDLFHNKCRIPY
jgi:hypothetical protein